jgi:hypothetical protein
LLVFPLGSCGQFEDAPRVRTDPTGVRQQPTLQRLVEPTSGALLLYFASASPAWVMPFVDAWRAELYTACAHVE